MCPLELQTLLPSMCAANVKTFAKQARTHGQRDEGGLGALQRSKLPGAQGHQLLGEHDGLLAQQGQRAEGAREVEVVDVGRDAVALQWGWREGWVGRAGVIKQGMRVPGHGLGMLVWVVVGWVGWVTGRNSWLGRAKDLEE